MIDAFDAYVTAVSFDNAGCAVFALGDGSVRFETGLLIQAHDGAVLSAAPHPSGVGLITAAMTLPSVAGFRIERDRQTAGTLTDAVATSSTSGLIAFAAGRDVQIRDAADDRFSRTFVHENSSGPGFRAAGRRWRQRPTAGCGSGTPGSKPRNLASLPGLAATWPLPGARMGNSWDQRHGGKSAHGWRVADEKNMRMGGYPAKPRSLAFLNKGNLLATSGANGVVVWPFAGATGPMGKQAAEVGYDEAAMVVRVVGAPAMNWVAAGLDDGRVWACDLAGQKIIPLKAEKGSPVTALAITSDARRVAWGCEDGAAGVAEIAS